MNKEMGKSVQKAQNRIDNINIYDKIISIKLIGTSGLKTYCKKAVRRIL